MTLLEFLGFIGIILVTSAYIPQIVKIWKTKNAEGISITAWLTWLVGTVFILIHAFSTKDGVFIVFQTLSFIFVATITLLAIVYRKRPSQSL